MSEEVITKMNCINPDYIRDELNKGNDIYVRFICHSLVGIKNPLIGKVTSIFDKTSKYSNFTGNTTDVVTIDPNQNPDGTYNDSRGYLHSIYTVPINRLYYIDDENIVSDIKNMYDFYDNLEDNEDE